ncbi:MAG: ABC transporter substrate-binding protein [Alphaproteobacteria bacterium]|nr:ABC transporter substrate-binding protein [Alphaproteobacteria bacterium]MBQ2810853.1 ABC transporter substrate-binding protein [Alphaproteobacteria bacterium]
MKKIIKNSIMLLVYFFAFAVNAAQKNISLYNAPKYSDTFSHFEYVNPDAPKGGKIVMPEYGGFDNFNPFIFKGSASGTVAGLIWDSLGFSPADDIATVYPLIAKEFEYEKDYVGFILDERAKFADGSKIVADDVIYSFNALTQQGAPIYKVYYSDVERVEKLSDTHVRFYFKQGSNNKELPLILSQLKIFSKKYWQDKDFSKPSLDIPLGNGPYKIKKFEAGKYIVLERDKNYWAVNLPSRKGYFNFDEIRIDYYQDTTVTLQALFAGNIDVREEYIAKIWATGYDNEQVKNRTVIKQAFENNEPAVLQHFAFNLRKDKFKDKRVRRAIDLAFNFEWANNKLFYNQYKRLNSYFTNSGMEAYGLPQGLELDILTKYKDQLDESVFTQEFLLADNSSAPKLRENLRQAVNLLQEAGFDFVDGKMTNLKTGEPLKFEILSNSANGATFTRVMLPFIANLKKIGIEASFRTIEVNIFKNRMDNFDFDVAIMSYRMSQMPGNELKEMFGSNSADVKGSYNIMGIKNEVVDKLIEKVVSAQTKVEYEAYVKALDRVLLSQYYLIFQWYSGVNRVGYRNKFGLPDTKLKIGYQPFLWWDKSLEVKN